MKISSFATSSQLLVIGLIAIVVVMYLNPNFRLLEPFCDQSEKVGCKKGDCTNIGYPYGPNVVERDPHDSYSTCYETKRVYLNSVDPDEPSCQGSAFLEHRWGKFYITLSCNLPYAKGGVFNTMWGSYHAFLVDSRTKKTINIGSLVYHGDHFYKLSTELLGDYSNFNEIWVYQQTEDYTPKLKLKGSI